METTRVMSIGMRLPVDAYATRRLVARRRASRKLGAIGAITLLAGIALVAASWGPSKHSIHGMVRDANRAGLPGVTLVFQGTDAFRGRNYAVRTDPEGAFAQRLPEGWTGTLLIDANHRVQPVERSIPPVRNDVATQDFTVFP